MQYHLTKPARQAVTYARNAAEELGHGYVGTEHLMIGLIRADGGMASAVLTENGVTEDVLLPLIEQLVSEDGVGVQDAADYTPRARRVIEMSSREAARLQSDQVGTEHLLMALIKEEDCIAVRLLNTLGVSFQKVYTELLSGMGQSAEKARELFGSRGGRKKNSMLESYTVDLTRMAEEGRLDPVIGREEETAHVIRILSRRTKNNPCLIGEPGVGKTAVVEGLAARICRKDVPASLAGRRLLSLDLSAMVAGSKYRGEFEERIKRLIQEIKSDGQILLFIDEIHTIIGAGGAEGALDASNILKPSLARGEIQVIGATTVEEYRKYIEKDAALERRFQPVMTEEPPEEACVDILRGLRPAYESHHGVTIRDEALEAAVRLSARYISDRFLPDKAIDVMDEAAAKVRLFASGSDEDIKRLKRQLDRLEQEKERAIVEGQFEEAAEISRDEAAARTKLIASQASAERKAGRELVVSAEDIADVISGWTKIPVHQLARKESERLLKLESVLHQRVIGQDEAVGAVAKAIRRGRAGLKDPGRPIGSFLFLGPTGVGKTELSKALAQAMFGSEDALIRVDMSESMEKHSVSKFIGSPPGYVGYEEGGQLSEKIRRHPYSILLFDEIEKAHPDVFNILLQVLDDGHITDSQGRKVDFKNTVIIMTSNAGAARIVSPKHLGFRADPDEKADHERMKAGVLDEARQTFKPEFINRIDEVIVFHALNKEHISRIAALMMKEIDKRAREQMGISIHASDGVIKRLAESGFDPVYGARPLRRAIQKKVEDGLAERILSGEVKRGDEVRLTLSGKDIKISTNATKSLE